MLWHPTITQCMYPDPDLLIHHSLTAVSFATGSPPPAKLQALNVLPACTNHMSALYCPLNTCPCWQSAVSLC